MCSVIAAPARECKKSETPASSPNPTAPCARDRFAPERGTLHDECAVIPKAEIISCIHNRRFLDRSRTAGMLAIERVRHRPAKCTMEFGCDESAVYETLSARV